MTHTTLDQARTALQNAYDDCEADFGPEAVEAGAFDLVHAIADDCTKPVRAELLRTEFGITDEEAETRAADRLFDGGEFSGSYDYEGAGR